MPRLLRGCIAVAAVLTLALTACGNSDDTAGGGSGGNGDGTTPAGDEEDRDTFVEISGVPGVTDDEIRYTVIGTKANNPLGTCILDCYVEGIEAYFAFRNDEGGIFGRDLVVGEVVDDELNQNQAKSIDAASSDDTFGVFQATLLAAGWGDLDTAAVPTYVWGIHATEFANRPHVWPSLAIRCADCLRPPVSYIAQQAGATKAASLGYGISENSKVCATSTGESIEHFSGDTGVELAYLNENLAYGLPNGIAPEVTAMKDAGVDFITACVDLNGMKTIAQELERQGMDDVVMLHPNTYDQDFVAEAGDLFEGDYVDVQFRPLEADSEGNALADFEEWMEETGSEPSELAMVGWINASLAFDGLLAAGPEFDRDTVTAATNSFTEFTAGGLIVPIDWTVAHTPITRDEDDEPTCASMVKIVDGAFETVAPPETPWLCWEKPTPWSEPTPTNFE